MTYLKGESERSSGHDVAVVLRKANHHATFMHLDRTPSELLPEFRG